jgi:hypothetical protein
VVDEKAELEGRNAVRTITPSGQSFSVSEYKVVGNVVDVMRVEVTRLTRNRFPGRYKASWTPWPMKPLISQACVDGCEGDPHVQAHRWGA